MLITQEQYDALTAEQKKLWKKEGDGYKLVGDTEIAAEMRRARDREKQKAEELQAQLDELNGRLETIEGEKNKKNKDIDAIEASWNAKVEAEKTKAKKETDALKKQLSTLLVDNVAQAIASEISTKPKVILPHIRARLEANLEGDSPSTRVLDADGKPSAMSLAELRQSFVDNEDFAAIIIGSKASGSGGGGQGGGSGGAKKPSEMTESERVALYRTNRAEFDRLFPRS